MEAKDVFLEEGYERASMDAVAARAKTSKRSVYAHFASKEGLFEAVMDLIRELYLAQLKTPDAYAADPVEAVTMFCGRYLQMMTWESHVRTCRLSIGVAERVPSSSRAYFEATFASTRDRLADYVAELEGLSPDDGSAVAEDLLARTVLGRLRTLLGVDKVIRGKNPPSDAALAEHVDLVAIRRIVASTLSC